MRKKQDMLSKKIEEILNKQIKLEGDSSHLYLAMASWADVQGLTGVAKFLYKHSDEERMHMLKLVRFVNERGGHAVIPELDKPKKDFQNIQAVFEDVLDHEVLVTNRINEVVHVCLEEKDYTTHNFMQWYVSEQVEEEALVRNILDKLKMIGLDHGGLYIFDRDLELISSEASESEANNM